VGCRQETVMEHPQMVARRPARSRRRPPIYIPHWGAVDFRGEYRRGSLALRGYSPIHRWVPTTLSLVHCKKRGGNRATKSRSGGIWICSLLHGQGGGGGWDD
jgi:hypothetical protein